MQNLGASYLRKLPELKYILAPILCKSEEQQVKFYELFDKYLEDVAEPFPQAPPPPPWHERIPNWFWGVLFGLLALSIVTTIFRNRPGPTPELNFIHEETVKIGDTAHFYSQCTNVPPGYQLGWELVDDDNTIMASDTLAGDWYLPIRQSGGNPFKKVRMSLIGDDEAETRSIESTIRIDCKSPPKVDTYNWIDSLQMGDEQVFSLKTFGRNKDSYRYEWFINEQQQEITADNLLFKPEKIGFYNFRVRVIDLGSDGFCEKEIKETIVVSDVQQEIAPLEAKALQKEPERANAYFRYTWWLFLGLLLLLPIYFWIRWWNQRRSSSADQPAEAIHQLFDAPDRPPYFLPFRPMNHVIHAGKELYEFANTLRQRQEGLRKELNVEKSLKATIEKGGFPVVRQDRKSNPSEYLFLIEDQHRDSVQSRLFEYLVDFLVDKDVYADRYFYKRAPHSLWKKKEEEALNLAQVQRNHPYYRLVIMGDAHHWLNEAGSDALQVKKDYAYWIGRWQKRVLLSPLPPQSWTYKEAGLRKNLAIFPADTAGIQLAFDELQESLDDEEPILSFNDWQQQLQLNRQDQPEVNYRNWRKIDTLKDYLKDYPDLWNWLTAIAVHPNISWELTLAIGYALERKGVDVSFNKLLILSRIPCLQQGQFPPRLRLQLLEAIDPGIEKIARQTVKEELEAIENLTKNSFVNFEHYASLATQNFLLDPQNPEYQNAIRSLTQGNKPAIGKNRFKELDQQIKKHQNNIGQKANGLDTFLKKAAQSTSLEAPRSNAFLLPALASSLLWLLLILGSVLINGNPKLHDRYFGKQTVQQDSILPLRSSILLKEVYEPLDLAAQLNNEAVDLYEEGGANNEVYLKLRAADSLRNNKYELAKLNESKFQFNKGVQSYQEYFDRLDPGAMIGAAVYFSVAANNDSLYLDAMHGRGLSEWYIQNPDTATVIYQKILAKDNSYFNATRPKPNLQTLLQANDGTSEEEAISYFGAVVDSITQKPIANVDVRLGSRYRTTSDENGVFRFSVLPELVDVLQIRLFKNGYQAKTVALSIFSQEAPEVIGLQKVEQSVQEGELTALSGVISNSISGQGVADVKIQIFGYETFSSGAEGKYEIQIPANMNTETVISFSKEGYTTQTLSLRAIELATNVNFIPISDLPTKVSLEQYCPEPINIEINDIQACFSVGYDLLTIQYAIQQGWTSQSIITNNAFSPWFLHSQTKIGPNCLNSVKTSRLLEALKTKGNIPSNVIPIDDQGCDFVPSEAILQQAQQFKIESVSAIMTRFTDVSRIIGGTKEALNDRKPVVITMKTTPSFERTTSDTFDYDIMNERTTGTQSLVIIGYDDQRNAFRLRNSRGKDWGDQGYVWISYEDFAELVESLHTISLGPSFGQPVEVETVIEKGTMVDPRDGQTYPTVKIGDQTWMASNLNYQMRDSWCYLELPEVCAKTGRLYTWNSAQVACPEGWRLPSKEDWSKLNLMYDVVNNGSFQALTEGGDSGLNVRFAGFRRDNGKYGNLSKMAYQWTSSKNANGSPQGYIFNQQLVKVYSYEFKPLDAMSCRCIKN